MTDVSSKHQSAGQQVHSHRSLDLTRLGSMQDWKLADFVYERIFGMIVRGEFPVNERLPSESKLSVMFQVSRPILRRALARLREDDLIHSRQGSGSYVKYRPSPEILSFAPVGSIADIQRCFEFREAVETEAARLAALRRTPEQLEKILSILQQLTGFKDLPVSADEQFHFAIAEATGNMFFVSVLSSLQPQIRIVMNLARSLSLLHPAERIELVQAEHKKIADAITRMDPVQAEWAMSTHLQNARLRVFEGEISK